ncbi:MAG TPA: hydrogenase 4 subunit B [Zetaproteobacteria bacterium]|nr:hydrogenase 4 subunit B [Zetaproteobacteria bacterium]
MDIKTLYLVVPMAPLAGAVVAGLFGKLIGRTGAHLVTILGVLVAFLASLLIFQDVLAGHTFNGAIYTWLTSGNLSLEIGFLIDRLTVVMMLVVTFVSLMVHIYTIGYMADDPGYQRFFSYIALFTFSMLMLVMSNNFLQLFFGWEAVGLVSYLLIGFWFNRESANFAALKAFIVNRVGDFGFLVGILAIWYYFGSFDYREVFAAVPAFVAQGDTLHLFSWEMSAITFICLSLFIGAMGKSGQVPLHVWLPDAHPVAPSHISALMSGAMLKMGIYGIIRVSYDLIGEVRWEWGVAMLIVGTASALLGVLYALMQHDLKRLLAYHSIENIGIILIGLGLGMLLARYGHPTLAALSLIAALYHSINHALFKGLLFMGAGAVLHSTGSRDMESMGGLIHRMPWTAVFFLAACLSISGLPPFNGFVSEWLIFQSALMAPQLGGALLTAMVPFSAAMLALAGALAAACFVKVFGIVFLGHARSDAAANAHETDGWMKLGMAIPAVLCLALGLLPVLFIPLMDAVPLALLDVSLTGAVHAHGWLWLTPVDVPHASYSAPAVLAGMLCLGGIAFVFLHPRGYNIRRSVLWSCGNPHTHARMQYSSTSFSQPLRQIFSGIYQADEIVHIERHGHKLLAAKVQHVLHVHDLVVQKLYQPLANSVLSLARRLDRQHQTGIHTYLAYTFATILFLLAVFI